VSGEGGHGWRGVVVWHRGTVVHIREEYFRDKDAISTLKDIGGSKILCVSSQAY
jgi:hypothetical protein